jgi:hypothetical protein
LLKFKKGKAIPIARPIAIGEDLSLAQVASIQAQAASSRRSHGGITSR